MGSHPVNLALRFILELGALVAMAMWGWHLGGGTEGWFGYIFAMALPILAAIIWGIFNVPNDPSRSGAAPIIVPGFVRLLIELAFFSFASWALYDLEYSRLSLGVCYYSNLTLC